MQIRKALRSFSLFLLISFITMNVVFSQSSGFSRLNESMNEICGQLMSILPPLSILLVVVAAIFYGAGKLVPNAEFSSRATNMAAAAAVGAVMCIVIVLLVPIIIQTIYGAPLTCGTQTWG
jgi:succinate dehydrogenase/fumarate reductase cytochrome b subunit